MVTAGAPAAQTTLDRKVFTVTGDLRTTTGTAADVLNNVSMIDNANAGYAPHQTRLGPWRAQGGVRLEAAAISSLQITGNIAGQRRDFGVYPRLTADRDIEASWKFSLGIRRRITRRDPERLNTFSDYQNVHNLRAGNARLLPQDAWNYEVGYDGSLKSVSDGGTAYYRFDRGSVTEVFRPAGPDVVLATKSNLLKNKSAGLEFNASARVGGSRPRGTSPRSTR